MANRRSPIPHTRLYPGPLYRSLLAALDARRRELGWTHARLEHELGIADGCWSKLLHPDGRSGRIPRWTTLERAAALLFPEGVMLTVSVGRIHGVARSNPGQKKLFEHAVHDERALGIRQIAPSLFA
jgi:hypothetical protein